MLRQLIDSGGLEVTEDEFLGGTLKIAQPKVGYRAGMDAVLLGAAIPAVAGQSVLDVGSGVGTAGLCLIRRVPNVQMVGVELQPELQRLATLNAENNGLQARASFLQGDIRAKGQLLAARRFDHVFSNPPYIAGSKGRSSDSRHADLSKREGEADLAEWIDAMLYWVKERGHITIIHRADRLDEIIGHLHSRVGDLRVCPVWPKRDRNANRVIIQGRREAKAGLTLSPGIVVRQANDEVTHEMEDIQRRGRGLLL